MWPFLCVLFLYDIFILCVDIVLARVIYLHLSQGAAHRSVRHQKENQMSKSPNQQMLETSLQAVLQEFYTNVVVPSAEADQTDPVELFSATMKHAVALKEQELLDEHRSSFFTLES